MQTITSHGLQLIHKSPLDYWFAYLNPHHVPYVPDDRKLFDDAFRCAVITPRIFAEKYVKQPPINKSTNIGKSEWAALNARVSASNQILLGFDKKGNPLYGAIIAMAQAVREHPTASKLFASGQSGVNVTFEPVEGANVSFKPHFIHRSALIVNLVSTSDATFEKFQKECWDYKYHKKAAIQMDGTQCEAMVFVQVEREAPYKIGLYTLDARSIELGRSTYLEDCRTYAECLQNGVWAGLPAKITVGGLPEWVYRS